MELTEQSKTVKTPAKARKRLFDEEVICEDSEKADAHAEEAFGETKWN